jgi:hypothetical protein
MYKKDTKNKTQFSEVPQFLQAISNYARALANLHLGQQKSAISFRESLVQNVETLSSYDHEFKKGHAFYDNRKEMAQIMKLIVDSAVFIKHDHFSSAVDNLELAVKIQDDFAYTEPENFYLPVRQCLGAVYMMQFDQNVVHKKYVAARFRSKAENVYEEDLALFPSNIWSVKGMIRLLESDENQTRLFDFLRKYDSVVGKKSQFRSEDVMPISGSCCELLSC